MLLTIFSSKRSSKISFQTSPEVRPPISPKTSPTSLWKSLVLNFRVFPFPASLPGQEGFGHYSTTMDADEPPTKRLRTRRLSTCVWMRLRGPAAIIFISRDTCSDSIAKMFRACFIGACAMTAKFLDNKVFTFEILLSWRFPRKIAFWTIFLSAPPPNPP